MSHNHEHHEGKDCDSDEKCKGGGCDCGEGGCGSGKCGGGSCHCGKGCCGGSHFHRHYQTKAEQIPVLEAYLNELKLEVQAVEEKLAELHK